MRVLAAIQADVFSLVSRLARTMLAWKQKNTHTHTHEEKAATSAWVYRLASTRRERNECGPLTVLVVCACRWKPFNVRAVNSADYA